MSRLNHGAYEIHVINSLAHVIHIIHVIICWPTNELYSFIKSSETCLDLTTDSIAIPSGIRQNLELKYSNVEPKRPRFEKTHNTNLKLCTNVSMAWILSFLGRIQCKTNGSFISTRNKNLGNDWVINLSYVNEYSYFSSEACTEEE